MVFLSGSESVEVFLSLLLKTYFIVKQLPGIQTMDQTQVINLRGLPRVSFVYICIAVGDPVIKRGRLDIFMGHNFKNSC